MKFKLSPSLCQLVSIFAYYYITNAHTQSDAPPPPPLSWVKVLGYKSGCLVGLTLTPERKTESAEVTQKRESIIGDCGYSG